MAGPRLNLQSAGCGRVRSRPGVDDAERNRPAHVGQYELSKALPCPYLGRIGQLPSDCAMRCPPSACLEGQWVRHAAPQARVQASMNVAQVVFRVRRQIDDTGRSVEQPHGGQAHRHGRDASAFGCESLVDLVDRRVFPDPKSHVRPIRPTMQIVRNACLGDVPPKRPDFSLEGIVEPRGHSNCHSGSLHQTPESRPTDPNPGAMRNV